MNQADGSAHGEHRGLRLVDVAESADETQCGPEVELSLHRSQSVTEEQGVGRADISPQAASLNQDEAEAARSSPPSSSPVNFRRWVSTLRKKKAQKPIHVTPRDQRWTLDDFEANTSPSQKQYRPSQHRKQGSYSSSVAFVTAVRSATATLASASVATVSRRNSKWRRVQRSSLVSGSEARPSIETQRSVMDEAAKARSRKRRERIEELIRTEEGYVADLKALSNVPPTSRDNASLAKIWLIILFFFFLGTVHDSWIPAGLTKQRAESRVYYALPADPVA